MITTSASAHTHFYRGAGLLLAVVFLLLLLAPGRARRRTRWRLCFRWSQVSRQAQILVPAVFLAYIAIAIPPASVVGDSGATATECEAAVHIRPDPLELLRIKKGHEFVGHHEHTMTALMRVGIPAMPEACMGSFKPKMQIVLDLKDSEGNTNFATTQIWRFVPARPAHDPYPEEPAGELNNQVVPGETLDEVLLFSGGYSPGEFRCLTSARATVYSGLESLRTKRTQRRVFSPLPLTCAGRVKH